MDSEPIPEVLTYPGPAEQSRHVDFAATADHVYETVAGGGEDQRDAGLALWFITQGDKAALGYGIRVLQRLARAGLTSAMHNLALEKLAGKATGLDYAGANALFARVIATEQQNTRLRSEAMSALADSHRLGRALPIDMRAALELYINAAELGIARAAFNAALIFENGGQSENTRPDYAQAANFYQLAMDLGYLPARTNLGVLHAAQLLAPSNPAYGFALLRQAIADGDEVAGAALAVFEKTPDPVQSGTSRG